MKRCPVLNTVKTLTEIKSWGGRRKGAGRKKDSYSSRAICEHMKISMYQLRQAQKVRAFDEAFGTKLMDRIHSGEIKVCNAHTIMGFVMADWIEEGRPKVYDASYANKLNAPLLRRVLREHHGVRE